jgi:hypothetical protein
VDDVGDCVVVGFAVGNAVVVGFAVGDAVVVGFAVGGDVVVGLAVDLLYDKEQFIRTPEHVVVEAAGHEDKITLFDCCKFLII